MFFWPIDILGFLSTSFNDDSRTSTYYILQGLDQILVQNTPIL